MSGNLETLNVQNIVKKTFKTEDKEQWKKKDKKVAGAIIKKSFATNKLHCHYVVLAWY